MKINTKMDMQVPVSVHRLTILVIIVIIVGSLPFIFGYQLQSTEVVFTNAIVVSYKLSCISSGEMIMQSEPTKLVGRED